METQVELYSLELAAWGRWQCDRHKQLLCTGDGWAKASPPQPKVQLLQQQVRPNFLCQPQHSCTAIIYIKSRNISSLQVRVGSRKSSRLTRSIILQTHTITNQFHRLQGPPWITSTCCHCPLSLQLWIVRCAAVATTLHQYSH